MIIMDKTLQNKQIQTLYTTQFLTSRQYVIRGANYLVTVIGPDRIKATDLGGLLLSASSTIYRGAVACLRSLIKCERR
jgi:hypothetical protein